VKKYIFFILVLSFSCSVNAQIKLNFELQAYPTGLIPGLRLEKNISDASVVHLRLGYNVFDHRDLGVQESESGSGFGFTLGYSKAFKNRKLSWGVRNDIWWNSVDWENNIQVPNMTAGTTDITVLQPTAELTYKLVDKNVTIRPSLAVGFEWNVKTDGEPTGEGAIVLLGVIIGY
jgi:hypothetical protein